MIELSAPIGAIVRVWFPESEAVMQPGPKFRPALVLGVTEVDGCRKVLVAYGTSQNTERTGRGEFTIRAEKTYSLESDTKFCLMRRLWLPLTKEYFAAGKGQPKPEEVVQKCFTSFRTAAVEASLI